MIRILTLISIFGLCLIQGQIVVRNDPPIPGNFLPMSGMTPSQQVTLPEVSRVVSPFFGAVASFPRFPTFMQPPALYMRAGLRAGLPDPCVPKWSGMCGLVPSTSLGTFLTNPPVPILEPIVNIQNDPALRPMPDSIELPQETDDYPRSLSSVSVGDRVVAEMDPHKGLTITSRKSILPADPNSDLLRTATDLQLKARELFNFAQENSYLIESPLQEIPKQSIPTNFPFVGTNTPITSKELWNTVLYYASRTAEPNGEKVLQFTNTDKAQSHWITQQLEPYVKSYLIAKEKHAEKTLRKAMPVTRYPDSAYQPISTDFRKAMFSTKLPGTLHTNISTQKSGLSVPPEIRQEELRSALMYQEKSFQETISSYLEPQLTIPNSKLPFTFTKFSLMKRKDLNDLQEKKYLVNSVIALLCLQDHLQTQTPESEMTVMPQLVYSDDAAANKIAEILGPTAQRIVQLRLALDGPQAVDLSEVIKHQTSQVTRKSENIPTYAINPMVSKLLTDKDNYKDVSQRKTTLYAPQPDGSFKRTFTPGVEIVVEPTRKFDLSDINGLSSEELRNTLMFLEKTFEETVNISTQGQLSKPFSEHPFSFTMFSLKNPEKLNDLQKKKYQINSVIALLQLQKVLKSGSEMTFIPQLVYSDNSKSDRIAEIISPTAQRILQLRLALDGPEAVDMLEVIKVQSSRATRKSEDISDVKEVLSMEKLRNVLMYLEKSFEETLEIVLKAQVDKLPSKQPFVYTKFSLKNSDELQGLAEKKYQINSLIALLQLEKRLNTLPPGSEKSLIPQLVYSDNYFADQIAEAVSPTAQRILQLKSHLDGPESVDVSAIIKHQSDDESQLTRKNLEEISNLGNDEELLRKNMEYLENAFRETVNTLLRVQFTKPLTERPLVFTKFSLRDPIDLKGLELQKYEINCVIALLSLQKQMEAHQDDSRMLPIPQLTYSGHNWADKIVETLSVTAQRLLQLRLTLDGPDAADLTEVIKHQSENTFKIPAMRKVIPQINHNFAANIEAQDKFENQMETMQLLLKKNRSPNPPLVFAPFEELQLSGPEDSRKKKYLINKAHALISFDDYFKKHYRNNNPPTFGPILQMVYTKNAMADRIANSLAPLAEKVLESRELARGNAANDVSDLLELQVTDKLELRKTVGAKAKECKHHNHKSSGNALPN